MLYLTLAAGAERLEGATLEVAVRPGQARLSIGRDPVCDWAIPDRTLALSARHCEVVATAEGWVLRDLSTNGTFVNGASTRMAADHPLRDGDRFDAGPYTVAVRWNPTAAVPAGPLTDVRPPAPGGRSVTVEDTDTHWTPPVAGRGRDPAAMAAALLPPEPEQDLDMTRIRLAPSRPAGAGAGAAGGPSAPRASGPTPMPVVGSGPVLSGPVPVRPAAAPQSIGPVGAEAPASGVPAGSPTAASAAASTASSADLRAAMAAGLGLPAQALEGRDPAEWAQELGRLVRSAVDTLRLLLDEQARARLMLGSRRSTEVGQASILQTAGTTDQALRALLSSAAVPAMAQAGASLVQHQSRLLEATRAMVRQTGAQLAPSALASLSPGADAAEQLALYAALWQRLGVAPPDAPWTEGFEQAALQRLASDYDRP